MADPHYTRDNVGVVVTSIASLGSIPYDKFKTLGVDLIYLNAADPAATSAKRKEVLSKGFRCGLFYPASTEHQFGDDVAALVSAELTDFTKDPVTGKPASDNGQTPVLLDFEPSYGSVKFWMDFIVIYRNLRPGRVTDFTPEPFKAADLPLTAILNAHIDIRVQYYFGDMSPADGGECRDDYISRGVPPALVRGFVDGGRKTKLPIFYNGQIVRGLQKGTVIWNANLLREAGLV